jgi:hypothetical protein
MHVSEGSDSGVVPMNHSNQDGKSSAESEEGRPLVKENIPQPSTHPTQSGARVFQGLAGVRLRRYSSAIRAVCANERTYGSVRGVPGNRHPYRDLWKSGDEAGMFMKIKVVIRSKRGCI